MPISDEIIELEPVKKTKSKLIIMFVIMGVMSALAITFLILYFLKEGVSAPDAGEVLNVETSSSELFATTDDQGNDIQTASVGNKYRVYATVGIQGEASSDIVWLIEPSKDALLDFTYGKDLISGPKNSDGSTEEAGGEYSYWCEFMPNEQFVGQEITLTARSQLSTQKYSVIKFTIVRQGTEHINFVSYSRGPLGAAKGTPIDDSVTVPSLEFPFYTNTQLSVYQERYYIYFSQKGKYNSSTQKYSDITVANTEDNLKSNAIEAISSDPTIIQVDNSNVDRVALWIKKVGEVEITIKANINNDFGDKSVSRTIKVVARSNADLRLIDGIYFSPEPVDQTYFENNWSNPNPPNSIRLNNSFTLPNNADYENILSHIVLTPYSVQYDKANKKLYTDWYDRIKIRSTKDTICTVSAGQKKNLRTSALSSNGECELIISDADSSSPAKQLAVKLNVVADNMSNEILIDDTPYKSGDVIPTSQYNETTLKVKYKLTAPAATEHSTMVGDGYVSNGFKISMSNSKFMSVQLVNAASSLKIDPSNPDTVYYFTDSTLAVTHDNKASTNFVGTATFKLRVNGKDAGVVDDDYTFTFTKIGVGTGSINVDRLDITEDYEVKFTVSEVAQSAYFVKDDTRLKNIVTGGGKRVGGFLRNGDDELNVYVQNQKTQIPLTTVLDLKDLIDNNTGNAGKVRLVGQIQTKTSVFMGTTGGDYTTLKFTGTKGNNNSAAHVVMTVYPNVSGSAGQNPIGTFNIYIYLVDGINSIHCETQTVSQKSYHPTQPVQFKNDSLKAVYEFDGEVTYTGDFSLSISYSSGNNTNTPLYMHSDGGLEYFYLDKTLNSDELLFTYNPAGGAITLSADIFAVGYKKKIDFKNFTFTYTIPELSMEECGYDQPALSSSRIYKFVRIADDACLFADSEAKNPITYDKASGSFKLSCNQGDVRELFLYAVVDLDKTSEHEYVVAVPTNLGVSPVEDVYFTIPEEIEKTVSFSESVGDSGYSHIEFKAPEVPVGDESVTYKTNSNVKYGESKHSHGLAFEIHNAVRSVNTIELLDKDDNPLKVLSFGLYNSNSGTVDLSDRYLYTKTFKIKVVYCDAMPGVYQYFESVFLKLPDYLKLSTDSGVHYLAQPEDGQYEFFEDKSRCDAVDNATSDPQVKTYTYIITCTVQLIPGTDNRSGRLDTDKIKLMRKGVTDIETVSATVGAGIKDIGFTDKETNINYNTSDNPAAINVDFKLSDIADAVNHSREIGFVINSLKSVDAAYGNIDFVRENLVITTSEIAGLKADVNTTDPNNMWVKLLVDKDHVKNITTPVEFKITFADFSSYVAKTGVSSDDLKNIALSNADKVFEIKLNVTVTVDIYSVDIDTPLTFVTTGGSDALETEIAFGYNDNLTEVAPTDAMKNAVDVYAAKYEGGVYTKLVGEVSDVKVTYKDGKLYILNTVYNGSKDGAPYYYLRVEYNNNILASKPIEITTASNDIRIKDHVLGEEGKYDADTAMAEIVVYNKASTYKLSAETFNLGTPESSTNYTVTHAMYDSASRTGNVSEVVSMNAETGEFKFVKPDASGSGTLYYLASYVDNGTGASGLTRTIKITVKYTVSISKVEIVKDDISTVFDGSVITLYYINSSTYTKINLQGSIKISTDFDGVSIPSTGVTTQLSGGSALDIAGYSISPNSAAAPQALRITAKYREKTVNNDDYTVNIVKLAAPSFNVGESSKTVNVVTTDDTQDAAVIRPIISTYAGLSYTYSIQTESRDDGKFTLTTANDETTVKLVRTKIAKDDYGNEKPHKFTVNITYGKDNSAIAEGYELCGSNPVLSCVYTMELSWAPPDPPQFALYTVKDGIGSTVDSSEVEYDPGTEYYLKHITPPNDSGQNAWYVAGDWGYSISTDNTAIAAVDTAFDKTTDLAKITIGKNVFGSVKFTVKASAYGNFSENYKTYKFTYAVEATTKFGYLDKSSGDFVVPTDGTVDIGYKGDKATQAKVLRYYIDASTVGTTLKTSDIVVMYNGDVTADMEDGKVKIYTTADKNKFYAQFTADGEPPATVTVNGTILVSGVTYYLDTRTLQLVATAPEFSVKADGSDWPSSLSLNQGVNLSVTYDKKTGNTALYDSTSVKYTVVSGAEYVNAPVSGSESYTLTPAKDIFSDVRVVIGVEVTVHGGAYNNKSYYYEQGVTILGVPLPVLQMKKDLTDIQPTLNPDGSYGYASKNFNDAAIFGITSVNVNGQDYAFTPEYTYSFVAPSGFRQGQNSASDKSHEYKVSGSELTVYDNDNTRAGGLFTLTVTASVKGSTLSGSTPIGSVTHKIRVLPRAKVNGSVAVTVPGKIGKYDISNIFIPYTGTSDGQLSADDQYTMTLRLVNGSDTVNGESIDSIVSVSGCTLSVNKNIAFEITPKFEIAELKMLDGNYAGVSVSGVKTNAAVTVKGYGFDSSNGYNRKIVTVDRTSDGTAYAQTSAADIFLGSISDIKSIDVSIIGCVSGTDDDISSYIRIKGNGTANPVISLANEINVVNSGNKTKDIKFSFIITDENGVQHYGEVVLAAAAVVPEVSYIVNEAEHPSSDIDISLDISAGSTGNIVIKQKNGLEIADVKVDLGDLSSYVTSSVSGNNILLAASDVPSATEKEISVSYNICGQENQKLPITKTMKVSISPRANENAFTITNNHNVTVSKTNSVLVSTWTSSPSNTFTKAQSITYNGSSLGFHLQRVEIDYVLSNGGMGSITHSDFGGNQWWAPNSRTFNLSGQEFKELTFKIYFKDKSPYTLNISYRTSNGTTAVNNETSYIITFTNDIEVSLDPNASNATVAYSTANVTYGNSYPTNLPTPERPGYAFEGWYLDNAFTQSIDGRQVTATCNHVLYAKWDVRKDLNAVFNAGIGEFDGSKTTTVIQTYLSKYKLPNDPTCPGYKFVGWTVDGITVTADTVVTFTSDSLDITAVWEKAQFNITLDPKGGNFTGGNSNPSVTYDTEYPDLPVPVRNGYQFLGWYLGVNGTGTAITDASGNSEGVKVIETGTHALYAFWRANEYTVTLSAGTGVIIKKNGTPMSGATITANLNNNYYDLDKVTAEKTGYTFDGWFTGANGTGTRLTNSDGTLVNASEPLAVAGDHSVYAHWIASKNNVTFDSGVSTQAIEQTFDSAYIFPDVPEKQGYTFVYWYDQSKGESVKFTATKVGTEAFVTGGLTLVAKWSANTYNVNLANVDNKNGSSKANVIFGESYDLPQPTVVGYTFAGWYATVSGAEKRLDVAGVTVGAEVIGGLTVTAKWTANDITVTFDENGGSTVADKTVKVDAPFGALTAPTKTGFEFDGWYLNNVKIESTSTMAATDATSITLVAKWNAKTYTVGLDAKSGSVNPTSLTFTYAADKTFGTIATPNRAYYDFAGWYGTETYDVGSEVTADTLVFGSGNTLKYTTLYAKWTPKKVNVIFNDGSTVSTVEQTFGDAYVFPDEPTKTGYTFDYWYDQTVNESIKFSATDVGTEAFVTGGLKLVAKWNAKTVTVEFNAGDGVTNPSDITVKVGEQFNTLSAPTKTGYVFDGWYLDGRKIESTTVMAPTDDTSITLVAMWSVAYYDVTLDYGAGYDKVTVSVKHGDKLYAMLDTERIGYTFGGWYLNGTKVTGIPQVTASATYVGRWTKTTYTVNLDACGGSVTSSTLEYEYAEGQTFGTVATPTNDYYDFDGWYGTETYDADSKVTADMLVFNAGGDTLKYTTLYAKWGEGKDVNVTVNGNKYTVTYGSKYSAITGILPSYIYGSYTGLKYDDTVVTEYATTPCDAAHGVTKSGSTLSLELTCVRTVTLDANGGQFGSDAAKSVITLEYVADHTNWKSLIDANIPGTDNANDPNKFGYTNGGKWYYSSDVEVDNSTITSKDVNRVYLKWTPADVAVVIDYADGATASEVVTVEYNSAYSNLAVPTRDGYKFMGWSYTAADGITRTVPYNDMSVAIDETHGVTKTETTVNGATVHYSLSVTAVWAKKYSVTYDAGDGAFDGAAPSGPAELVVGESVDLPQVTNAGGDSFVFLGWYKGTALILAPGTIVVPDFGAGVAAGSSVTLIAKWKVKATISTVNMGRIATERGKADSFMIDGDLDTYAWYEQQTTIPSSSTGNYINTSNESYIEITFESAVNIKGIKLSVGKFDDASNPDYFAGNVKYLTAEEAAGSNTWASMGNFNATTSEQSLSIGDAAVPVSKLRIYYDHNSTNWLAIREVEFVTK